MKVIKIGGGCFKDETAALAIIKLIYKRGKGNIFVLSAFSGVTDLLLSGISDALKEEKTISTTIKKLKTIHYSFINYLIDDNTENNIQKQNITWKDTEGFMTADPDNIKNPKLIPKLSYVEAAELAYTGAGILHPRTVEPVKKAKIDIAIKNTKVLLLNVLLQPMMLMLIFR